MTMRTIAIGQGLVLALALAISGCSKPADPAAAGAGPGANPGGSAGPGGGAGPRAGRGAPKAPADPMAGAKLYPCENGSELHVVINKDKSAATVRLDDGEAVYLPREQKPGIEAYSDDRRTLGVSPTGDFAYTEAPAPPKVCRAATGEPPLTKDPAMPNAPPNASKDNTPSKGKAGSSDLPAPKVSGVTRNFTAADKGKTIEMKLGEKVSISLVGIPTAGYVWAGESVPSFLKVSDGPSGPTIAAQNQPGYAGGNHWEVLVVEAVKAGEGDLVLAMRRPWERKAEPDAETFSVKVKVK